MANVSRPKNHDPLEESMGLRAPKPLDYQAIARRLRQYDKGAFGKRKTSAYNNRVLGTSGAERFSQ